MTRQGVEKMILCWILGQVLGHTRPNTLVTTKETVTFTAWQTKGRLSLCYRRLHAQVPRDQRRYLNRLQIDSMANVCTKEHRASLE